MKWKAEIISPRYLRAVIKKKKLHELISSRYQYAYYLYIYEGNNTYCTWDHMQYTLDIAMQQAWEDFGIPLHACQEV